MPATQARRTKTSQPPSTLAVILFLASLGALGAVVLLATPNEARLAPPTDPFVEQKILTEIANEDLLIPANVFNVAPKRELAAPRNVPERFRPAMERNAEFARYSRVIRLPDSEGVSIEVEVTAYTWHEPNTIDATGRPLRPGIIALSPDLVREFGFKIGDSIELEGLGAFEYRDHMASFWNRRVDIFLDAPAGEVNSFGVRRDRIILRSGEAN